MRGSTSSARNNNFRGRLVADEGADLRREVRVRGAEHVEIALREQVHDEKIVALAQQLVGDRTHRT
jgi:hypothetical protein